MKKKGSRVTPKLPREGTIGKSGQRAIREVVIRDVLGVGRADARRRERTERRLDQGRDQSSRYRTS